MSENSKPTPQSDEIDLGQLFKMIGNVFQKLYDFIASIFKGIFSITIYSLKVVVDNIKIIALTLFIALAIGYALDKYKPTIYFSQMYVRPYFDSKYQLVTNINYYNALIADKDYSQLQSIFNIDEASAKEIVEFDIQPGPESENERIQKYDEFLKSIDSTRASKISYEEYKENRSIYSGDIFEINVRSLKKDIFRNLEEGLNSTFTNTYSVKKMQKRDSIIQIEKAKIQKSIAEVDSLQNIYIKVLQEEAASSNNKNVYTSKDGIALVQERVKTREYDLLQEGIKLRNELSRLETLKVEEDVYFDTISSFQDVGSRYSSIWNTYIIVLPAFAFILLTIAYLSKRIFVYVKNYE